MTPQPAPETSPRVYSVTKSRTGCSVLFDASVINSLGADKIKVEILYSDAFDNCVCDIVYTDGSFDTETFRSNIFEANVSKEVASGVLEFHDEKGSYVNVVVLSVSYLKEGVVVGSSLIQDGDSVTTLLKYKVDLQAKNANVNVWDESVGAVTALSWKTGIALERNQAGIIQKRGTFSSDFSMLGTSGERELEDGANTTSIVIQAGTGPLVIWLSEFKLTKDNGQVIDYKPTAGRDSVVTIL